LLSIGEPSEGEELWLSFENASRASSPYHGHPMVVALHDPEDPIAHLCFEVADLAREKCCDTFRFCAG
jgi:hypothetical protein